MGLTSPTTAVLSIILAVFAIAACLLVWNRLGSRRWLAIAARAGLVLLAQALAVASVAFLINNHFQLYTSWNELLGSPQVRSEATAISPTAIDKRYGAELRLNYRHGRGTVIPWQISGTASGLPPFPAYLYLPAAYGNPAAPNVVYPVIELFDGVPGTPQTWFTGLHLRTVLDGVMRDGRAGPFIAVLPTQNVLFPHDTQCLNVVGGPQVDTYLTEDVHAAVVGAVRAATDPGSWAAAGYSTGGYCASNLAMRHPDLYSVAASMSGYAHPEMHPSRWDLLRGNVALRHANTPLWEEKHWGCARLSILAMASAADGPSYRDTVAFAAGAKFPLEVSQLLVSHGGHNAGLWIAEEPYVFQWLSLRLTPAHAQVTIKSDFGPLQLPPTAPVQPDSQCHRPPPPPPPITRRCPAAHHGRAPCLSRQKVAHSGRAQLRAFTSEAETEVRASRRGAGVHGH